MNYEDMTDFDLDCKLAEIAFDDCTPYKDSPSGLCMVNLNKPMEDDIYFNPCNNPSDAWPIMMKNKITVIDFFNEYIAVHDIQFNDNEHSDSVADWVLEARHKNPLRAAMIVYLMMQEQK